MKRTILALGAAAALGIAGTSHAVVYFGKGDISHAVVDEYLAAHPNRQAGHGVPPFSVAEKGLKAAEPANALTNYAGGVGHMLFSPYFSAQGNNQTIFTIVNTDEDNGKAVKVRFRSAANSDDLLDFTLLLSPGDVWSASVTQNSSGMLTVNPTEDTTCTLPAKDPNGWTTLAERLPGGLAKDVKAVQTLEGYIEVLNMADIPKDSDPYGLYQSIEHQETSDGTRVPGNCSSPAVRKLLDTVMPANSDKLLSDYGLSAPTGGLFGSWWILNQDKLAGFSGAMTAIRAEYVAPVAPDETPIPGVNAPGNVVFAPQVGAKFEPIKIKLAAGEAVANIQDLTADPLLTGEITAWKDDAKKDCEKVDGEGEVDDACKPVYSKPALKALWYDLPDMSTPILEAPDESGSLFAQTPTQQIESLQLRHSSIMNEYTAAPDYDVPMTTDWVVSQPTRRYYAAVDYNTNNVWLNGNAYQMENGNPYDGLIVKKQDTGMPVACISGIGLTTFDREEGGTVTMAELSGGSSQVSCGEVFVMSFGGTMLNAKATQSFVTPKGQAGWGYIGSDAKLPLLGFAATAALNEVTNVHYDTTYPHRWND